MRQIFRQDIIAEKYNCSKIHELQSHYNKYLDTSPISYSPLLLMVLQGMEDPLPEALTEIQVDNLSIRNTRRNDNKLKIYQR